MLNGNLNVSNEAFAVQITIEDPCTFNTWLNSPQLNNMEYELYSGEPQEQEISTYRDYLTQVLAVEGGEEVRALARSFSGNKSYCGLIKTAVSFQELTQKIDVDIERFLIVEVEPNHLIKL
jgi:hypothetical protein